MPELPEVETIRKDLRTTIVGKEIINLDVRTKKLFKHGYITFLANVTGNIIKDIHRRGKLLYAPLQHGDYTLLFHLKMTGQLIYQFSHQGTGEKIVGGHPLDKFEDLPSKHTHLVFIFEDDSQLFFNDVRKFGYVELVNSKELDFRLSRYGLEPLTPEFTLGGFKKLFENRKRPLKSVLLDQQCIAGIGNIYADEICFKAKVHPSKLASEITLAECKRLYNACNSVIKQAVEKRGTTFSDYVDASGKKGGYLPYLKVYGRQGRLCLRCEARKIEKTRLSGRGTHFCPACQVV